MTKFYIIIRVLDAQSDILPMSIYGITTKLSKAIDYVRTFDSNVSFIKDDEAECLVSKDQEWRIMDTFNLDNIDE